MMQADVYVIPNIKYYIWIWKTRRKNSCNKKYHRIFDLIMFHLMQCFLTIHYSQLNGPWEIVM